MKTDTALMIICLLVGFIFGFTLGVNVDSEPVILAAPVETVIEETEQIEEIPVEEIPVEEIQEVTETKEYLGEFKITAYCPCSDCCGKWANGITSTGVTAIEGRTIAVDPKVIPYGSIVEIDGKRYVAEDTGGAIKKNRIDMYFDSHKVALNWGVQYHDVYLID